jgi:hypothetical protein
VAAAHGAAVGGCCWPAPAGCGCRSLFKPVWDYNSSRVRVFVLKVLL